MGSPLLNVIVIDFGGFPSADPGNSTSCAGTDASTCLQLPLLREIHGQQPGGVRKPQNCDSGR